MCRVQAALLGAASFLAAGMGPAAAEPPKPDQLVVREFVGTWGEAFKATIAAMFTAKYGIPIVVDPRLDPTMSLLVESAVAQHRQPPIDVSVSLENSSFEEAARGLMVPLTPEEIPNIAALVPSAHPVGHPDRWTYVNFATDILTLVYRKSAFPAGPPKSLEVMFDPKFKGRIIVGNTSLATIMLVALAQNWQVPADMNKIWDFIADRVKPQEPILGNDPEVVNGFQRNEIDLAFTFPANAEGLDGLGWTITKEGMLGLDESLWIPKGLPPANEYWAKQFVNFALSREALQVYCAKLVIPCFRTDLTLPPEEENDPYFPKTPEDFARIRTTPFEAYSADRLEWEARYDALLK